MDSKLLLTVASAVLASAAVYPLSKAFRTAQEPSALAVAFDEHNLVAANLSGTWMPLEALALEGRVRYSDLGVEPLQFIRDDAVAARVPARHHALLRAGGVHLAGRIEHLRDRPVSFVLTSVHGGPVILIFDETVTAAVEETPALGVQLVPAPEANGDLLFLCPDPARSEPVRTYARFPGGHAGRVARAKMSMIRIENALYEYAIQNSMRYPEALDQLVVPDAYGFSYLREEALPLDPWGNPYVYEPPSGDRIGPTLRCLGAHGLPGGDGEDLDFDTQMIHQGAI